MSEDIRIELKNKYDSHAVYRSYLKRKQMMFLCCNRYLWYAFSHMPELKGLECELPKYKNYMAVSECKNAVDLKRVIANDLPHVPESAIAETLRIIKAISCELLEQNDGVDIEPIPLYSQLETLEYERFIYYGQLKRAFAVCFYGFDCEYGHTLIESPEKIPDELDINWRIEHHTLFQGYIGNRKAPIFPEPSYRSFFGDQSIFHTSFDIIGETIIHSQFGEGEIIALNNSDITVKLINSNEICLPFPAAFENTISFNNKKLTAMMWYYLKKTTPQRRINQKRRKDEAQGLYYPYNLSEETQYYTYVYSYAMEIIKENKGCIIDDLIEQECLLFICESIDFYIERRYHIPFRYYDYDSEFITAW